MRVFVNLKKQYLVYKILVQQKLNFDTELHSHYINVKKTKNTKIHLCRHFV